MADISTANLDAGTDSPAAARAELLAAVQRLNAVTRTTPAVGEGSALIAVGDADYWKVPTLHNLATESGAVINPVAQADRTGVIDSTAAFNAVILRTALAGGGTVRPKPGIYKISTSILLPNEIVLDLTGVTLQGTGGNTLIKSAWVLGGVLTDITTEYGTSAQGAGTYFVGNARVKGGRLRTAACGIRAHRWNYGSTIENVTFEASLANSWISSHSWGLKVHQCTVYSPAVMKDFVDWTEVSGNSFEGPGVVNGTAALTVTTGGYGGSYSAAFRHNGFHHWGNGIVFSCEGADAVIESNHFEDVKYHVSGGSSTLQKFRIAQNWMKANLAPSGGGVIAVAFLSLWDSQIGPNYYSTDGASSFDAHVSLTNSNCFGNKIELPYSPQSSLDVSMYSVNDANEIILRGGSNNASLSQPTVEHVSGSGNYTIEQYRRRYHAVPNVMPYCTVSYSGTTITIDCSHVVCDAYGIRHPADYSFIVSGTSSYQLCGRVARLTVASFVNAELFSGGTGLAIAASNSGGVLRLTITGAPSGGYITGWVKQV